MCIFFPNPTTLLSPLYHILKNIVPLVEGDRRNRRAAGQRPGLRRAAAGAGRALCAADAVGRAAVL